MIGIQTLNRSGSLFGVLCYTCFSNILFHGVSFRSDSICSFLFLFSVYHIFLKQRSRLPIVLSGFAMGLSLMVSIKVLFHLATIVLIFLILFVFQKEKKHVFLQFVFFTLCLTGTYLILYIYHVSMLPITPSQKPLEFAGAVSEKVILLNNFFPNFRYFALSLYENPIIWCLLFLGVLFTAFKPNNLKPVSTFSYQILFIFLVPLLTLLFYRNAYPYYYVFIIAPGIIFCGVIFHELIEDYKIQNSPIFLVFAVMLSISVFINFIIHYNKVSSVQITAQKNIIKNIHKIFPEPVPYIDRCSAIASFKKCGFLGLFFGVV